MKLIFKFDENKTDVAIFRAKFKAKKNPPLCRTDSAFVSASQNKMGDPSCKPKPTTATIQSQTMIEDGPDKDHSKRT